VLKCHAVSTFLLWPGFGSVCLYSHIVIYIHVYVADVVCDYPEELRPERSFNFTEVMAISADTDPRGVEKLKHRLREVLDFHAALKQEDIETNVISTLEAQMIPKGPQML
jgi:hypothetical protein